MFEATLKNRSSAHFAPVTITFPIPEDQYEQAILALKKSQIGDARVQDCLVVDVCAPNCPALVRMTGTMANVDELDWLGKQLESFDRYELLQFNAAVERFGLSAADELIDLSFCVREVTVISDFTDLEKTGKRHYLTVHGACDPKELENLDGYETALLLIEGGGGTITPYGVVYDNGMKLSQLYDGRHFPEYFYESCLASVILSLPDHPMEQETLYFPCAESKIARTLRRLGAERPEQCVAMLDTSEISEAVRGVFEDEYPLNKHLETLNALTRCLQKFDGQALEDFHTVFDTVWPETPEEILYLAEELRDFTVVPDISSAEEYGWFLIKESKNLDVDPKLEAYIDYQKYGQHRIQEEGGHFGDRGYVAYLGSKSEIRSIMDRNLSERQMNQSFWQKRNPSMKMGGE